jgi:ankyrin repeat protein
VARWLVTRPSTNVNIKDLENRTPLHWAAESGCVRCLRGGRAGLTGLRHVETVVELLKHPLLQLDAVDSARRTPVHFAVVEGGPRQRECILLLWRRGSVLLICAVGCVLMGARVAVRI